MTNITPFERCMTPIPRSPTIDLANDEYDWVARLDRLAEQDAVRKQAEAQESWIKEVRARLFRNVYDYPKAKK